MSTPVHTLDSIFSTLPAEIIIFILHEACRISSAFCMSLSQTSTWTRRLAMPHLYSTVTITKLPTAYSMPNTLRKPAAVHSDPPFIPAPHVGSLWIGPVSKKTVEIFTMCENLTHVALQEDNFYWLVHASTQGPSIPDATVAQTCAAIDAKPGLEVFILNVRKSLWHGRHLVPIPPTAPSPLFSKVRRLWIGKTGAYDSSALNLQHFTRLTHVAVPYHSPSVQRLGSLFRLLEYPNVECFVLVLFTDLLSEEAYDEGLSWVVTTRKHRPKLLALPLQHESLPAEWEEGLCSEKSVWQKAIVFTNFLDTSRSSPDTGGSSHSD